MVVLDGGSSILGFSEADINNLKAELALEGQSDDRLLDAMRKLSSYILSGANMEHPLAWASPRAALGF